MRCFGRIGKKNNISMNKKTIGQYEMEQSRIIILVVIDAEYIEPFYVRMEEFN